MENKTLSLLKKIEEATKGDLANCFNLMQPKVIEYIEEESLKIAFPVLEKYLNPRKSMQGGFITAAFDNAFGALFTCAIENKVGVTIDISTSYQRPIYLGDELIITAYLKLKGNTIIHMIAEAHNKEGKLIATANTNMMIVQDI